MKSHSELRGMLDARDKATTRLMEATIAKRELEFEITREVFDQGMLDCLSVNWQRLSRMVSKWDSK